MKNATTPTKVSQRYHLAQAAQYTAKDLLGAIALYDEVIATYPDAPEAGYSRSQLANIANQVVPKAELLEAHRKLAIAHLQAKLPAVELGPAAPVAPETLV